ncbi:somatomedin-B and thrombospondin type-1 domain-containing protein isoform X2 [Rhagoletis pomonella]|uniref:somatomedin-B and thrombospondin type-1 domain-containing protein isoform X2 n=1 Tax=Rhagoletis pomonella TaxID=28610 RepID=UPI00177BC4EB|nr:somatomedin-B and thrombospondin type-1 domain-containing protein isoform X2 [Rhagoletis pomonella]
MCISQSEISSMPIALTTTSMEKIHHQRFLLSALILELLTAVALLLQLQLVSAGSCREAQLCCAGRDSSCVVQKTPINAIIEDLNDKPCYCDHACLKLGDCCGDFKDHCGVIDCQVGDWTPWSECDESCGTGITLRTRNMTQAPQNGGKHCPTLTQKRSCQGFRCHGERGKRILHETAFILPSSLAQMQHSFNKSKETLWHKHDPKRHNTNEYCIEFEVIKAAKECHKLAPYNLLMEGDRIAVHCNKRGTYHKLNLRNDKMNSTPNNEDNQKNWPEYQLDSNAFEGDEPSSATVSIGMNTVSVTTPLALRRPIVHANDGQISDNARCRGEGVPGRTTRWRALAAPSCRGKWLRLTLGTPKKCPHSKFVFV